MLLLLLLLMGCSPASFEDLRCEGEAETRKIAVELRSIENKEQLLRAVPRLKKRFNRLAELLLEVKKFPEIPTEPSKASEELFIELARLYEIPGAREIVESAQGEAVKRIERIKQGYL